MKYKTMLYYVNRYLNNNGKLNWKRARKSIRYNGFAEEGIFYDGYYLRIYLLSNTKSYTRTINIGLSNKNTKKFLKYIKLFAKRYNETALMNNELAEKYFNIYERIDDMENDFKV